MSNKGFYLDMTTCIGCRTCQVACKDKNNLEIGILFRNVKTFETGVFPNPGIYHYSATCNHCDNAKCVTGCPTGAMYKAEDGTTQHDNEKCIGCKYCTWNCPYGVPQFIATIGKVGKCDMCKDLTDQGKNPVCVDSCLMRCIKWGDMDELKAQYGMGAVQELPILPAASVTTPNLLIKPRACALDSNFAPKEV